MIKRTGDVMAWLGGGDPAILAQVPQERTRFVQMAGVLLTTAGIAVVSMTFALYDGVKAPLAAAVILGLLWGVVIFNLDRFLVLSMGSTRDRRRLIFITLPRLALAVVLALVISTPLVLRIFSSDINQQLFIMQQNASRQDAALEAGTGPQQQANRLKAQIAADEGILNGHLPQSITSPQLQSAQAQVNQLQKQAQSDYQAEVTAREAWQCELTGQNCVGSSGKTGNGPRAQAKDQEYQQALENYNAVAAKLSAAQAAEKTAQSGFAKNMGGRVQQLQAAARQALPRLQSQYQKVEAQLQGVAANGQKVDEANTGILAQLQALSQASAQSPSLQTARLAVLALFFLIEILPVMVKFLLNIGPPSAYEVVAQLREDELIDAAQVRRIESRRIGEAKSQIRINVEADMREKEEDLGRRANSCVAGEMTKVLDVALQEWSRQVRAKLPAATLTAGPNGGGASGSIANGSATNGSATNGSATNGSAANGGAANGGAANGGGAALPGTLPMPGFGPYESGEL
jgi:hypothetical protein